MAASRCGAFQTCSCSMARLPRVNNVPVPLGLDQEIACIMRLIAEGRAAVAPTAAPTERRCRPRTSVHPDQVGGLILRVGAATRVSGAAETGGFPRSRLPLSPLRAPHSALSPTQV